jgi:hypothetical protein
MQNPARRRFSIALGAAFALHAACALIGYRIVKTGAVAFEVAPPLDTEIEFFDVGARLEDVAPVPADELPSQVAMTKVESAQRAARPFATRPSEPRPSTTESATSDEVGRESGAAPGYALDPSAEVQAAAPPGHAVDLGIGSGDWSRFVDPTGTPRIDAPRAERSSERARPASTTGGIAEALEAHDQKVGIGPAGAVLSAIHEAGYSDAAPAIGSATFSITVLRSGAIDVQLTGVSSEHAAWSKVGDNIVAAIRKKPPRIPPSRSGVRLSVEVVAEERWPNGQATRENHGPKVTAKAPQFKAVDEAQKELLERNPAAVPDSNAPTGKTNLVANVDMPGIFVEQRGKVCSYRIGLSPTFFSGGCDPSNIGAKARRVVSTKIVSQTMF